MCGICGEINFLKKEVEQHDIEKMMDALYHRGPDDAGLYCDASIGLGHRRLSILDLSAHGKQPMWSNDRSLCLVYNGEVYNYREIQTELSSLGYQFSSSTDTEVVVNAVHCWGLEKALSKFIGMFAFAIWDARNKLLHLCRDRAGVKPLYYYQTDKTLIFGSEMKALLSHPTFRKDLDPAALGQYFVAGYFPDSATVFRNTSRLSPGHYLTITAEGATQLHKYWSLETIERDSFRGTFEEAVEHTEQLLESAFAYRLVSDVPVGLFLSGGIDSSLTSAILKKKIQADILNITIGFHEKNYDETPQAKKVAQELGVRHLVHHVTEKEAQDALFKFCDIYDEPFGDTSGIPTYILSKLTREHVKVALSADGGDEQFCGYESYASYDRNYRLLNKFPYRLRHLLSVCLKKLLQYQNISSWGTRQEREESYFPQSAARYEKMLRLLKIHSRQDLIRLMNEKAWSQDTIGEFLSIGGKDLFSNTVLSDAHFEQYHDGLLDAMMRTDYSSFLRDDILVKVDRASMHVSLECRDPFLDHRIAEFAYSLPTEYLLHNGEHKRILKQITRKWLSESIISAPKRGFMIPLYYWLRGTWKPIVHEYLSREKVRAVGFLDEEKVQREVKKFYGSHGQRAEKIWMMLNFQMWAEKWYQ
jgi:asparagine synthase (glutamine-hydrolysing)